MVLMVPMLNTESKIYNAKDMIQKYTKDIYIFTLKTTVDHN